MAILNETEINRLWLECGQDHIVFFRKAFNHGFIERSRQVDQEFNAILSIVENRVKKPAEDQC